MQMKAVANSYSFIKNTRSNQKGSLPGSDRCHLQLKQERLPNIQPQTQMRLSVRSIPWWATTTVLLLWSVSGNTLFLVVPVLWFVLVWVLFLHRLILSRTFLQQNMTCITPHFSTQISACRSQPTVCVPLTPEVSGQAGPIAGLGP